MSEKGKIDEAPPKAKPDIQELIRLLYEAQARYAKADERLTAAQVEADRERTSLNRAQEAFDEASNSLRAGAPTGSLWAKSEVAVAERLGIYGGFKQSG